MKKISQTVGHKKYEAICKKIGSTLWVHYNGKVITYEPQSSRSGGGGAIAEDPSKIVAPMPGKVVKILVNSGDTVSQGQVLAVMEAMKMEYSLKSHMDGKVKKVNSKLNQQVELGAILVELE